MKKKKGFTLLEMIVVVMIITVLFLLTLPNVSKVMNAVDEKACDALTKVVDTAIVQFRLEFDENPSSIEDLVNAGYLSSQQTRCNNGKDIRIIDGHASAS